MASKPLTKAQKRQLRIRRARRRRILTLVGTAAAVVVLAVGLWLILRKPPQAIPEVIPGAQSAAQEPVPEAQSAAQEPVPEAQSAAQEPAPEPQSAAQEPAPEAQSAAQEPVPEPQSAAQEPAPVAQPEPTPTVVPGSRPDVLSFYTPQGKNYSPRVRMGDTYTGPWKKGKDIGSFEAIPSDDAILDGSFFGDIFGAAWTAFPDAKSCKIGYTLRYTLDDGSEIRYTMLSPSHIEHTEYIECWLYDDYHQTPHKFYSHLKPSRMKDDTLITSIKLTAGAKISHVTDIWLTAFVCASLDDFDADRNYIGDTSCTIHILKQ